MLVIIQITDGGENMNYEKLLAGKKVLITSGAHGMGYAISKMFIKHGADVAFCGRNESGKDVEVEFQKTSPNSFFFQCDVTDNDRLDAFCAEAIKRFGYVDTIVNNVGINARDPVEKIKDEDFDYVFNTNFKPIIRINRNLLPTLIETGKPGSIIHISTVHAQATVPLMGSYVASKGAMTSFSRSMAVELGRFNIRSNIVAPGYVFTMPSTNMVLKWMKENPGKSYKEELLSRLEHNPLRGDASLVSMGRADDIAHGCLYFASEMSSYVTGMVLMQDGGASYQAHKVRDIPVPDYYHDAAVEFHKAFPYPEPKE